MDTNCNYLLKLAEICFTAVDLREVLLWQKPNPRSSDERSC